MCVCPELVVLDVVPEACCYSNICTLMLLIFVCWLCVRIFFFAEGHETQNMTTVSLILLEVLVQYGKGMHRRQDEPFESAQKALGE